jgi:ribosomal protein L32
MAIQTVYQKRQTMGKQVFTSVFVVTVIVSFLLLSYLGFSAVENILLSAVVFLAAFGFALISTASVATKTPIPQMTSVSSAGYSAPTAFSSNSRLYGVKAKPKFQTELHTCKRCGQVMLSGINTCPKCGWYTPRV